MYDVRQVRALAQEVINRSGFDLVGVMTYDGQVAGVPDDVPGERAKSLVVRWIKSASIQQLDQRRLEVAEALRDMVELKFWNAGGSGSVESSAADPVVTEVSAGSGLLVPHQTPLVGPAASSLRIGDLVCFRHAKSGEVAEHTKPGSPARRFRGRGERDHLSRHG